MLWHATCLWRKKGRVESFTARGNGWHMVGNETLEERGTTFAGQLNERTIRHGSKSIL
jgi:hypothetical protein